MLASISAQADLGGPCFRPDGRQLACATDAQTVTMWETATGQPSGEVSLPLPLTGRLVWDPSGRYLGCPCAGTGNAETSPPTNGGDIGNAWTGNATTGDASLRWGGTILVWDWARQRVATQLVVPDDLRAAVLAFHPSGERVALATRRGRLCVFELTSGRQLIDQPAAHPFDVPVLGWSDDGRQLVSWGVTEGLLKCWELSDPPRDSVRTGPLSGPFAIGPDGRWLAVMSDDGQQVQVIDRTGGTLHQELMGNATSGQSFFVFSQNGQQLCRLTPIGPSSGTSAAVRCWLAWNQRVV